MNETRKLVELRLWDKNPRSIKDKDFARLKKQIQKLGQYKPILITKEGEVIGGNMRLRAYQELGIDDIWVSVVNPKDEAEKLEYALSDNDRAGFYDDDLIANLMPEYPEFNWGDYAVDLKEPQTLDDLIQSLQPIEEDEVPEVSEGEADSKLGEVYELGRHRLMCGDSTKIEDVEKLMNGQKAELLFTSPPYMDMRDYGGDKNLELDYLLDFIPTYYPFCNYQVINLGIKRDKGEIVRYWDKYIEKAYQSGYKLTSWNIWNRESASSIGMQSAMFPIFHEWIFVFGNETKEINRTKLLSEESEKRQRYSPGTRRGADGILRRVPKHQLYYDKTQMGTVITMKPVNTIGQADHPAMFPIALPFEYIRAMTNENDNVIDCFGGSGSTLIACEQTNRTCYMMELDPKYCDVIRKRYNNYIDNRKITA